MIIINNRFENFSAPLKNSATAQKTLIFRGSIRTWSVKEKKFQSYKNYYFICINEKKEKKKNKKKYMHIENRGCFIVGCLISTGTWLRLPSTLPLSYNRIEFLAHSQLTPSYHSLLYRILMLSLHSAQHPSEMCVRATVCVCLRVWVCVYTAVPNV